MNINMKYIKIIIVIIILFVLSLIISFVITKLNVSKIANKNKILDTNQILDLMKYSSYYLKTSENLEYGSITDESKVGFSYAYVITTEPEYDIYIDYENYLAKIDVSKVNEISNYIFDNTPNYNNVSYEVEDGYVYVPILPTLGDAKVYKYYKEEYNKQEDTYITYIDVLESTVSELSEIKKTDNIDYDRDYVVSQLQFKYKIVNDRKVLVAFNVLNNW